MATLYGAFPFLATLYADGGYQGPELRAAVKHILARMDVEIVKRSDQAKDFVTLPNRSIVEPTFARLGRRRRLAKDWECLSRKALAFLRLASIRLMRRKLGNPASCFRPNSQALQVPTCPFSLARNAPRLSVTKSATAAALSEVA